MSHKIETTNQDTGLPLCRSEHPRIEHILRVVLTADNHLRMTSNGSVERGRDFFKAARSVVQIAERCGADAILNAGDFFNTPESLPLLTQQLQTIDHDLQRAGLPMYVVQGNHDYAEPSWISVQQGNHREDLERGVIHADGLILDGLVLALPFLSPDDLRKRLANLTPEEKRAKILMWHGPVLEFCKFPVDNVITIQDFMVHNWTAVLLGDIHQCSFRRVPHAEGTGSCIIGYPGATELCAADEPLTHTCTVMDIHKHTGVVEAMSHIQVAHREVIALRINSEDELAEAVAKVGNHAASKNPHLMVLAKFSDAVPGVRHALQRAVPDSVIIRAESFPSKVEITSGRVATSDVKRPQDYLADFQLPTNLLRLCETLCNPDSEVSPAVQLEQYCNPTPATA